jgi:signal transduction histidine kinase/phage shock protein PspC (stress-responsive transcriptional regulator)
MIDVEQRKAYRALAGRKIAGVAQGLAMHLGIDVRIVRIVFVATAVLGGGAGILAYLAFWALLPMDPDQAEAGADSAEPADSGWLIILSAAVLCGLLAMAALGFMSLANYLFPIALGLLGLALVWTRADEVQRAVWRRNAAGAARDAAADAVAYGRWRTVVGAAAVVAAVLGIAVARVGAATMLQGLATTLLLIIGLVLVAFPWLHAQWQKLSDERSAHIRADERADMAARIHDSVLQTLTLVQKHADDPQRVLQLARSEERELRDWLYGTGATGTSFTAAVQHTAHEVEARHGVTIDVVSVGDVEVDSRIEALLAAAQEAMVNAAKHSGAASVQVFAEVEPESISVFVRDRGRGFDSNGIAADRAGVRESIEGRMKRAGGSALVKSREGDGTEVALTLPKAES